MLTIKSYFETPCGPIYLDQMKFNGRPDLASRPPLFGIRPVGSDTKATQNLWLLPVACSTNCGFLSSAHWDCGGQGPYWGQVGLGTWDNSHPVDVTSSRRLNPHHLHLKNGDYMCLFARHSDGHNVISFIFVPKCVTESHHEETWDKTKLKEILQIKWPVTL